MGSPANARHVLVPLLPSALTVVESHTLDAGRVFGIWSPLSPAYPPPKQNCARSEGVCGNGVRRRRADAARPAYQNVVKTLQQRGTGADAPIDVPLDP